MESVKDKTGEVIDTLTSSTGLDAKRTTFGSSVQNLL